MKNLTALIATAFFALLLILACEPAHNHEPENSLGIFDNTLDIGEVSTAGNVAYDKETGIYTLFGSSMNGKNDALRYLWKAIQGDFILRAEVEFNGDPGSGSRLGWSVRNNISSDSELVNAVLQNDGQAFAEYRSSRGGEIEQMVFDEEMPDVIQLSRIGDTFIMKAARMGEQLKEMEIPDVGLNNEIHAGLFVQSGSDELQSASFKNVRIVKTAPEDFAFYQNYLGGRLEVMDIETGIRKVVYETEHSIEAPNWTPDGEKLIYNSNGYLYNFELETGKITHLNTGFATNNNNDHVITFDGTQIAISHHVPEDNNQSTIFILPIEGSDNPRQVTETGAGHAYLHGISPDNQTVIFTGWRNGKFDIYAADVNTMEETQLTDTPYLDDGSEYSPDGEYIWFNSNRTGAMQIWRMRPDGSEQTQMTFDEEFNDWFPHVSPDGKWILIMSYGTDVDSGDHPFYREVTLRLMPAEGGEPEIIAYLYGGQGTINVPSWAPDSKRFSFVSHSGRFY
jgi:TolB protein